MALVFDAFKVSNDCLGLERVHISEQIFKISVFLVTKMNSAL